MVTFDQMTLEFCDWKNDIEIVPFGLTDELPRRTGVSPGNEQMEEARAVQSEQSFRAIKESMTTS